MKVLITGGAGYIGTALTSLLLQEGHCVVVFDSLLHGVDALLPFFRNPNFEFILGDVRDADALRCAAKGVDAIVHLAAIVGLPACKAYPFDATSVNVDGSKNVLAATDKRIVYASTVSSYGAVFDGGECTEESPLKPLSLYGETKAVAEGILLKGPNTVALRFATLFGLSARMRLDLLVNDFTYQAVHNGSLVVYQSSAIRAVVHVLDAVEAIYVALSYSHMAGEIYNVVGCNLTKNDICNIIKKETKAYFHFAEVGTDGDGRNAVVNGDKLFRTNLWTPKHDLEDGVHEMARAFKAFRIPNAYANV
jgi:nucleoside-diphosphate-sugar epimerase